LQDSGLDKRKIDEIVLVGGSSKVPKIHSMVTDFFGTATPLRCTNPEEAIVKGASIYAGMLSIMNEQSELLKNALLI